MPMSDSFLAILIAANGGYVPFLAAHLYSLSLHNKAKLSLEITVLYQDICLEDRQSLESLVCSEHQIYWIEVNEELCQRIGAPVKLAKSLPNYFRLLGPYLYPDKERIIYLDVDTVIIGDLVPLKNLSLEGNAIGAVTDWLPRVRDAVSNWAQLGLKGDLPYFNSGVLVINLPYWREKDIALQAFEICQKNDSNLLADGKWPQHEQYGLNLAIQGKWLPLSPIWNHFTEIPIGKEKPIILHFLGQGKPGFPRCCPEFNDLFEQIIRCTPWREWWPNLASA